MAEMTDKEWFEARVVKLIKKLEPRSLKSIQRSQKRLMDEWMGPYLLPADAGIRREAYRRIIADRQQKPVAR